MSLVTSNESDLAVEIFSTDVPIPLRFKRVPAASGIATEMVVLLHGYRERADRILRLLGDLAPPEADVLAVNGPFPVPIESEKGWKQAYSWYFYDTVTQSMLVSPQTATVAIQALLAHVAPKVPVRLVGYSQGGYFGPILAQATRQVRHCISISAGFPARYYPETAARFRLDAINGVLDKVVSHDLAKADHATLMSRGWAGEFVSLPSTEHRIDDDVRSNVQRLLSIPLPERR